MNESIDRENIVENYIIISNTLLLINTDGEIIKINYFMIRAITREKKNKNLYDM